MSFTIDSNDPRTIKALTIAAGASSWLKCTARDGRAIIGVPSQCKPGVFYLVDPIGQTCDCQDARRRPSSACKHVLAVRLHQELVAAQQPKPKAPQPQAERPVLQMVREPDGTLSWERPARTLPPMTDMQSRKIFGKPPVVNAAARYDAIFGKDEEF